MMIKMIKTSLTLLLFYAGYYSAAQALYPFKHGYLWGYIDSTGTEVLKPKYEQAGLFYDGLAYVQIGEAMGYINVKGEEVIKAEYQAAYNFSEGLASVMLDEDWGVINAKGEMVVEPMYAKPFMYQDGLARFKQERGLFSTYGFINSRGDTVIQPEFEKAGEFNEGLCMASKDGQFYGYINAKGEWVIEPTYEIGGTFKIGGEYDFSDKNFSSGYVAVQNGEKYGLIDKTGKQILKYEWSFIGKFSEGLAPAKKDSLYGYINLTGDWVIEPQFNGAEQFLHGLAAVSKGPFLEEKWGFINAQGVQLIPFKIHSYYNVYAPMVFGNGLVPCYVEEGVFGYLDRKGKVIWKMEKE